MREYGSRLLFTLIFLSYNAYANYLSNKFLKVKENIIEYINFLKFFLRIMNEKSRKFLISDIILNQISSYRERLKV